MTPDLLSQQIYVTLFAAAEIAAPPLGLSAALGLGLGLLQAVVQIQDQSLAQAVKIFVISLILLAFGGRLALSLYQQTVFLLDAFPRLVR